MIAALTDDELYARSTASLLASFEEYARGAEGAALERLDGVAVGVFPHGPERIVYNNAVLDRGLGPRARRDAVDAMEAAYAAAGIDSFAAWVHERDGALQAELVARGYTLAETTRAMAMALDDGAEAPGDVALEVPSWPEYVELLVQSGAPPGILAGADPHAFRTVAATLAGARVAAGISYDHAGDCAVFNVSTLEHARRRGLGTAITARLVRDAAARGCTTASLQSTPMAERIYASVGFRDLGRILEFAPPATP